MRETIHDRNGARAAHLRRLLREGPPSLAEAQRLLAAAPEERLSPGKIDAAVWAILGKVRQLAELEAAGGRGPCSTRLSVESLEDRRALSAAGAWLDAGWQFEAGDGAAECAWVGEAVVLGCALAAFLPIPSTPTSNESRSTRPNAGRSRPGDNIFYASLGRDHESLADGLRWESLSELSQTLAAETLRTRTWPVDLCHAIGMADHEIAPCETAV